ncbi:MAG: DinB family protein [Anaerolineae bacterium]|nr:DinB family protein [Anaerolineae bacterium]
MHTRAQALIDGYAANSWLIQRHAEGLTDAGALRQPDFEAISFNWVLGHIVNHRNIALQALGAASAWSEALDAVYEQNPAGLTVVDQGLRLAQLLTDLAETERRLGEILETATDTFLDEVVDVHMGPKPRYDHVAGLQWHETYHVGQLGILKSLAMGDTAG